MKLLALSGSLRAGSFNTMLVKEAIRLAGDVDASIADLDIPLFNEDVEKAGVPAKVTALVDAVEAADALVISTTEYNKGPSGVLKNALDWISRRQPWPTLGKPVALLSATGGRAGGEVSQFMLRQMLVSFQVRIVPGPSIYIGGASKQFDENGRLKDEKAQELISGMMERLKGMA